MIKITSLIKQLFKISKKYVYACQKILPSNIKKNENSIYLEVRAWIMQISNGRSNDHAGIKRYE